MLAIIVIVMLSALLFNSFFDIFFFNPRDVRDSKEGHTCIEGGGRDSERERGVDERDR